MLQTTEFLDPSYNDLSNNSEVTDESLREIIKNQKEEAKL